MSLDVYDDYLGYVLPKYASQIIYLYLSEHRTPAAVQAFLHRMYHQKYLFLKLKSITIRDIPLKLYRSIFVDILPSLNTLQSLTIDMNNNHYHYSDYDKWTDIDFIVQYLIHFLNYVHYI